MLAALEQAAVDAGVATLILNTGSQQPEAIALYESSGYTPIPGFGAYIAYEHAYFFSKQLVAEAVSESATKK